MDTTVMPKAIAHPPTAVCWIRAASASGEGGRGQRAATAPELQPVAPRLAAQIGRYAHAKQFKRMNKAVRTLRTRIGQVHREVQRQLRLLPEVGQGQRFGTYCSAPGRILTQRTRQNKLYALHAPEVDCISKGQKPEPHTGSA